MHFAVSPFNVETVEMLLSANANLLLRDNHGQTAVDIAEAAADHDPIVLEKMIKAFTYQEQAASLMNILLT